MKKNRNVCHDICIMDFKNEVYKRFIELCGFFENPKVDSQRKKEALYCFEKAFQCFESKSIYSFFDCGDMYNKDYFINNWVLGKFFDRNVLGMFLFGIAVTEKEINYKISILEEFYFDLTGTAIVDVSRDILRGCFFDYCFSEFDKFFISRAFGVGFFDIEHDKIYDIFDMLDCHKINLCLNESGVMKPDKSFVGFFVVSENEILIENDCRDCVGDKAGCYFCKGDF